MARAGVFVGIDAEGQLRLERGYVRPEDGLARTSHGLSTDLDAEGRNDNGTSAHAPQAPGQATTIKVGNDETDSAEEDGEDLERPLPDRLISELSAHRTLALRDVLGSHPAVAFQAVLHSFVLAMFYPFASALTCMEIALRSPSFPAQPAGLQECASAKSIAARHASWNAGLPASDKELWEALSAMDSTAQAELLAHCASQAVYAIHEPANRIQQGRMSAHAVRGRLEQADRLSRATGLDMVQAGWKPTVDNFLGRVTKHRILQAVREAKGEASVQLIDHLKKADMAREAERLLEGSGWLPESLRATETEVANATAGAEAEELPSFSTRTRRPWKAQTRSTRLSQPSELSFGRQSAPRLRGTDRPCKSGPIGRALSCRPWPGRTGREEEPVGARVSLPGKRERSAVLIRFSALLLRVSDMTNETTGRAASAAPCTRAHAILQAAHLLLPSLAGGERIDAVRLRRALQTAFGASDAEGGWDWKTAYEACEAAAIIFLAKFGPAMIKRSNGVPSAMLPMVAKIAALLPSHTRRSQESQSFQQFSTPLPLALAVAAAAQVTSADRVLEPSAGTGGLAIFAELAGGSLLLNELSAGRASLLDLLFPDLDITRFDAAQIHDHLDAACVPSVVLMNPPFSATANVNRPLAETTLRHLSSALARLGEGGRLVAITGAGFVPDNPAWTDAFVCLQERGRLVLTAAIDGAVYARQGTTVATGLLVIDKQPALDPRAFPPSAGLAPDVITLLGWITALVPARLPMASCFVAPLSARPVFRPRERGRASSNCLPSAPASFEPEGCELVYELADDVPEDGRRLTDALYEPYQLRSIRISGARPHPTRLVQSAAMASVVPPRPSYRPHLLPWLVTSGVLSDAQLESIVYAGEAHGGFLAGSWTVDETFERVQAVSDDTERAVRLRRGWFLGEGTGAGKGRQVAGILLDNWLKGRRRAIWISKSDKLIEDAQRDWSSLGMERLLVTPLSRFRQGTPIRLDQAILFTTHVTLRTDDKADKLSRVRQIIDWVGRDFDGVIIFDESHAMQNAAGNKGERGDQAASQQGRAGLRLQHALPNARIVYVSATGATTVHNLAYAQRLGLWGGADFPFATRADFVEAIEEGGVAAMEVVARDLKALGLYAARSLSFEGVEYELLEHRLSDEQVRIYDAYAEAFAVIHNNLEAAMRAANITNEAGTLNATAKSAARSAFESAKQRFFGHLLTSMKTPTLIAAIRRDLDAGHAAVIQIVSTGEALMERRLAEIPTEEWGDVQVDITPREYVLDYLAHSFPVQLYEPFTDGEGNLSSRPAYRDGQPVESREAVTRRDQMIERLASLAPVPGALDQIVQRFGTEVVAEVTGRSRRIVRIDDRLTVETRAASANLAEVAAFMDDQKRILVFSDAGGTGRSYHAELSAKNKRLRVHYLLEPGWEADAAIQGLGRTNRTNQAQPPLFRPIATDVKAEKRFSVDDRAPPRHVGRHHPRSATDRRARAVSA